MARCQHKNAEMKLVIRTFVDLELHDDRTSARMTRNWPADIHVEVTCSDCGFHGTYNAGENGPWHAKAIDWPKWLLWSMKKVAVADPSLRKALVACEVPGIMT